jgi:hypothetical protein
LLEYVQVVERDFGASKYLDIILGLVEEPHVLKGFN